MKNSLKIIYIALASSMIGAAISNIINYSDSGISLTNKRIMDFVDDSLEESGGHHICDTVGNFIDGIQQTLNADETLKDKYIDTLLWISNDNPYTN